MTVIPRVGTGVDFPAFGPEGTPLHIAGLHWPGTARSSRRAVRMRTACSVRRRVPR